MGLIGKNLGKNFRGYPMAKVEKCWRCGAPCNPVQFLRSRRNGKALAVCGRCAPVWNEGGRMPK